MMKNKCGYCQQDAQFILVDTNFMNMISKMQFKCINECGEILSGTGNAIVKHLLFECPVKKLADNAEYQWKDTDKILCCAKYSLSMLNDDHLCNPKQEERFCANHKKEKSYLITKDKVIDDTKSNWKGLIYDELIERFHCVYCNNLPRTPMICSNKSCEAIFCKLCVNNVMKNGQKLCPKCLEVFSLENGQMAKNEKMVQMFLLVSKLNLSLMCKNSPQGCTFKAKLTENINKPRNLGFTLNNHILRNHELTCQNCKECRTYCTYCKLNIPNSEYTKHLGECKIKHAPPKPQVVAGGILPNNANAPPVNNILTYKQKVGVLYGYMFGYREICCLQLRDHMLVGVMGMFLTSCMLNFTKLVLIERMFRAPTYTAEINIAMSIMIGFYLSGYFTWLFASAYQGVTKIKTNSYYNNPPSFSHTRYKNH